LSIKSVAQNAKGLQTLYLVCAIKFHFANRNSHRHAKRGSAVEVTPAITLIFTTHKVVNGFASWPIS
jgi:hypothetical protein